MRLYLDTAPVIYLIEGAAPLREAVAARLAGIRTQQDLAVVSRLTLLECRVKPLQDGNVALLDLYDRFFSASGIELVETDASVWDKATEIRAHCRVRIPDALHLACAIVHRCERFLTNDHRLDHIEGIPIEIVIP